MGQGELIFFFCNKFSSDAVLLGTVVVAKD